MWTKSPAVARIAERTGCQWPSRSSKVNDFYLIWQGVCHFLLAINSNSSRISDQFRDMASFPLKRAHFSYPLDSISNFENVTFGVNHRNFACPSFTHITNYLCKKFFPTTHLLARVHLLQTDEQTDDNHANSSTVT